MFSYIYVGIIVPLCIIIPIVITILKYRKLSPELKVIGTYLVFSGITNVFTIVFARQGINNMPLLHIYTPAEFAILSVFYAKILHGTALGRHINKLSLAFVLICLLNVLFFQSAYSYNSYVKSIEAIVIILYALAYYRMILDRISQNQESNTSVAFINTAFLLYFSGSFIFFIIPNLITPNISFGKLIWTIHATFLLLMYILVAIGLWKHKK